MGDRVGLIVMLAVVVILVIGLVIVGPRRPSRTRLQRVAQQASRRHRAGASRPPGGSRALPPRRQPARRHHHRRRLGRGPSGRGCRARGAARGRPPRAPRGPQSPPTSPDLTLLTSPRPPRADWGDGRDELGRQPHLPVPHRAGALGRAPPGGRRGGTARARPRVAAQLHRPDRHHGRRRRRARVARRPADPRGRRPVDPHGPRDGAGGIRRRRHRAPRGGVGPRQPRLAPAHLRRGCRRDRHARLGHRERLSRNGRRLARPRRPGR